MLIINRDVECHVQQISLFKIEIPFYTIYIYIYIYIYIIHIFILLRIGKMEVH